MFRDSHFMKIARLNRLFNPQTRRCFDVALDHGFFNEASFLGGIENLPRAIETATPLAKLTGVPLRTTDALRERSVGVMEGLTFEEAAEQHPVQYQALLHRDFEHVLAGGESYRQTLDRASRQLDEAIEQHKGGRIALFAHTGTICILILHLMGALDAPELKPVWISSANCGITRFELRDDGFVRVLAINDTRHLTEV